MCCRVFSRLERAVYVACSSEVRISLLIWRAVRDSSRVWILERRKGVVKLFFELW